MTSIFHPSFNHEYFSFKYHAEVTPLLFYRFLYLLNVALLSDMIYRLLSSNERRPMQILDVHDLVLKIYHNAFFLSLIQLLHDEVQSRFFLYHFSMLHSVT